MKTESVRVRPGVLILLGALAGCGVDGASDPSSVSDPELAQSALVMDTAHGGDQGLFFLPPLVKQPMLEGAFAADLDVEVQIGELDADGKVVRTVDSFRTGAPNAGDRVERKRDHYAVNWHTRRQGLTNGQRYRISVWVAERTLGFVDVLIMKGGGKCKSLKTGEEITLVNGQTLPIKFWMNRCAPVVCQAQDGCHQAGVCDPDTAVCSNPVEPDGTACSDGNACTQTDSCRAGVCAGANPVTCTASDQCHDVGICNPATGVCSNPDKANGTACSDGNACTLSDSCQAGVCWGANPVICTASDQCHDPGVCNPATGACSDPAKADGAACSDGDACTRSDTCQAGACQGADPLVCSTPVTCAVASVCQRDTGTCSQPAACNEPPSVRLPGASLSVRAGQPLELSAISEDDGLPAGSALSYAWSAVSGPGPVRFESGGAASTRAFFDVPGNYVVRVDVSDSMLSAFAEVAVNVTPNNQAPVVSVRLGGPAELPATGKLVVVGDEWTISDGGFDNSPTTVNFVRNLGRFFSPTRPGNFLVHSNNFGLNGAKLANTLRADGHSFTVNPLLPFDLLTLRQFDAVFIGAEPRDNQVLINYVNGGGNVYLMAGTSHPIAEAAWWRPLLNAFGFDMDGTHVAMGGNVDAPSFAHPLFAGVSNLFFWGANPVIERIADDPWTSVMLASEGGNQVGRLGVFQIAPGRTAVLDGTVTDDGLPAGLLTRTWQVLVSPGRTFLSGSNVDDIVLRVSVPGTYKLRLLASDSALLGHADVTISFPASPF